MHIQIYPKMSPFRFILIDLTNFADDISFSLRSTLSRSRRYCPLRPGLNHLNNGHRNGNGRRRKKKDENAEQHLVLSQLGWQMWETRKAHRKIRLVGRDIYVFLRRLFSSTSTTSITDHFFQLHAESLRRTSFTTTRDYIQEELI